MDPLIDLTAFVDGIKALLSDAVPYVIPVALAGTAFSFLPWVIKRLGRLVKGV
jgi:hypothetical protein